MTIACIHDEVQPEHCAFMKLIDSAQTNLLAKALDVYSLRQKVTAANIANLDTPGYSRKEISFEEKLRDAESLPASSEKLDNVEPSLVDTGEKPKMEEELLNMADTQIRFQLVSKVLRQKFDELRTGITGNPR